MTTSANDVQHGGSHYKGGYQHWDFVATLGLDYYIGNASKYLSRWQKKNGLEDLLKAQHYIQKRIELEESPCSPQLRPLALKTTTFVHETHEFLTANGLELTPTGTAIMSLVSAHDVYDLKITCGMVAELIAKEELRLSDNPHHGHAPGLDADDLTAIARKHAFQVPLDYCPQTAADLRTWEPHAWVLEAMREVSAR